MRTHSIKSITTAMIIILLTIAITQVAFAADSSQSTGGLEIQNRTADWAGDGTTISRVEYLSYSSDDINNANWKVMCAAPLSVDDYCTISNLTPGMYVVRTLKDGQTIEVFTDVEVVAGSTITIVARKNYVREQITIYNESGYDIEHIYAQEGNYVSDPVSHARKPIIKGEISPGSWQTIQVNGDFDVHHIFVRDERNGYWFYEVPAGGLIMWTGGGGDVYGRSLFLDFQGNPPGAAYMEVYQGDFREVYWGELSNGTLFAPVPTEEEYDFWNTLVLDTYCGDTSYGGAFCTIYFEDNSPSSPFVIDGCNFNYACNGRSSMDIP